MKLNDTFTRTDGPVTREQIKEYAKASGDMNPIHIDEEYASTRGGLNGVIAHGMLFYGYAIHLISEIAINAKGNVLQIESQMRGMVRPGDWVITIAKVSTIDGKKITLEIDQYSKMPLKLEKDGQIVKVYEGEERKWVKDKETSGIKTETTPEGTLTYREWISIKGKAIIQIN